MKASKLASEPQVKTPAWPPVEMMYFLPALTNWFTFWATSIAGVTPAQFSEPHSPEANAQVSTGCLAGMTVRTGTRVPETIVEIWSTFQSMLIVTSLYEPNRGPVAGGGDGGVGAGGAGGVGAGGAGGFGGVGAVLQLVVIVHGWPVPVMPLCVAGSSPWVYQLAL
jgi:hypothetical protein